MQTTYHFVGIPTYFTCKTEDLERQVATMRRKLNLSYDHSIVIVGGEEEVLKECDCEFPEICICNKKIKTNDNSINSSTSNDTDGGIIPSDNQELPTVSVGSKKTKTKRG